MTFIEIINIMSIWNKYIGSGCSPFYVSLNKHYTSVQLRLMEEFTLFNVAEEGTNGTRLDTLCYN